MTSALYVLSDPHSSQAFSTRVCARLFPLPDGAEGEVEGKGTFWVRWSMAKTSTPSSKDSSEY